MLTMQQRQLGCSHSSMFGSGGQLMPTRPLLKLAAPIPSTITAGIIGPGKRWEHYETNDNGKVVRVPMHVRLGDTVQVIAGSDKGKVGKVTGIVTKTGQVVVEGVNVKTKHVKPRAQGETGQIAKRESLVHHSNVMLYSESQKVRSRVGYKMDDSGNKVRFLKKTGEVLPNNVPGKEDKKSDKKEGDDNKA